jgi:hypothetical protein
MWKQPSPTQVWVQETVWEVASVMTFSSWGSRQTLQETLLPETPALYGSAGLSMPRATSAAQ